MSDTAPPLEPEGEEAASATDPAVPDGEQATVAEMAMAGAGKPQAPRWVPAMIAIALAAGIGIGLVIGLVVGRDGEDDAAAVTTIASGKASAANNAGTGAADPGTDPQAYGSVTVSGTPLPRLVDGTPDLAVGQIAPEVSGADFDGRSVSITNDGNAKMIVFLSHWCPHCQRETPIVRDWMATAALPSNVNVYSVSTLTSPDRANYPPAPWLAAEQWNVPLIADDPFDSVANAFGLHAVPFWVLVNTDGTVAGRGSGAVPAEALSEIAALLAQGPAPAGT